MLKLLIASALALTSVSSMAQAPAPAMPACSGQFVAIRYSEIKPGQWALFEQAVKDHQAWYAANDPSTTVRMLRVMKQAGAYDDASAMTITYYGANSKGRGSDAAWQAFVKKYNDASTMKEEHRACLPQ